MKKNIVILALEPISTRYTGEWHQHIPNMLFEELGDKFNIIQIDGDTNSGIPTEGAFLDFLSTNQWKNEQVNKFFTMVKEGRINKGDHILITDAWNPVIIEINYVNKLMNMNWITHGLFHSGSYDKGDFLGRLIGDAPWVRHAEKSFFHCYDHNYFATDFHINMFLEELLGTDPRDGRMRYMQDKKIVRTGWPMDYMKETLQPYTGMKKENIILFPHRIAPEKQLEIFKDLEKYIPEAKFVVCQERQLTKHEYHKLLSKSKIVFSANLQETLGISTCAEGPLVDCLPLAPDRLSYSEIFKNHQMFLYPDEWTENWDSYITNRENLVRRVKYMLDQYETLVLDNKNYIQTTYKNFFHADEMVNTFTH